MMTRRTTAHLLLYLFPSQIDVMSTGRHQPLVIPRFDILPEHHEASRDVDVMEVQLAIVALDPLQGGLDGIRLERPLPQIKEQDFLMFPGRSAVFLSVKLLFDRLAREDSRSDLLNINPFVGFR